MNIRKMSTFKLLILIALLISQTLLWGCGRKGNLYPPETDKGEAQYDQSFIFPPTRTSQKSQQMPPKDTK